MNLRGDMEEHSHLKATLNTWQLWGIAVGLVISGEYFGWSYGWASAGTLGFLLTTILVATMYAAFIFSFTELTTAIPNVGGPFAYAQRAGWRSFFNCSVDSAQESPVRPARQFPAKPLLLEPKRQCGATKRPGRPYQQS